MVLINYVSMTTIIIVIFVLSGLLIFLSILIETFDNQHNLKKYSQSQNHIKHVPRRQPSVIQSQTLSDKIF